MDNWIATNELRFEARKVYDYNPKGRVVRILQQKWLGEAEDSKGFLYEIEEWRDVPVVEEE